MEVAQIQARLFSSRSGIMTLFDQPENLKLQPHLKRNHPWTAVAAQTDP